MKTITHHSRDHGAGSRTGVRPPAYAAIDLGTNNCRMLIGRPTATGFRVVDSFSRIVRLGEGMGRTGRLGDEAIVRTIDALQVCAAKAERWQVRGARHVATEACRRAENCGDFMARVRAETGIVMETITAQEEARLTLAGCSPLLDRGRPYALVFDIGGGSTEVMWIRLDGAVPSLLGLRSLPCGVVTLAERFGAESLSGERFNEMVTSIDDSLAAFDDEFAIADHVAEGVVQMAGTSGTVTTLGAVHLDLQRYDRGRIDGLVLPHDHVLATGRRLSEMDWEARKNHPCIGAERADLVIAGCAILEAIMRRWPVDSLRIADRGIREGILMELMASVDA